MKTETEEKAKEKEIPFTQYLMPDGRTREMLVAVPDHVYLQAKELMADGYEFEAEILMTGEVSLTVVDTTEEEDIAIQICPNGPGIHGYIEKLISEALAIRDVRDEVNS